MKTLFSLLLISAITFISCSSEKEYPVKITEENGVKTLSNPDYPKEGLYDLVLEELFTLGKDEDNSKYMFTQPQYINLDSKLNLYVLDWEGYKFFVFDKQGNYLRQFGRRGQGPGDFDTPLYFAISNKNELILNDAHNTRICYLDSSGKYLNGFIFNKFHGDLLLDTKDNLYTEEEFYDDSKVTDQPKTIESTKSITRYSFEKKEWESIGKFTGERYIMLKNSNGSMTTGPINKFVWYISKSDFLINGFSESYEFFKYSLDGKPINKFNRKPTPIANRNFKEGTAQKRFLDPFTRFNLLEDNGNFWVNINNGYIPGQYIYDVFNENGVYLKQVHSKYKIELFRSDRIYSIVHSEKDPTYIKAFKYSLKKREK